MSSTHAPAGTALEQPRRTQHKARTRSALLDAALELVAEHGYDAVTTDDIAAAAGVSPRTFFRYFPTKESVLLSGEDQFIAAFAEIHPTQPAALGDLEAIAASFVSLAPILVPLHARIRLYNQAIASSHVLRGQEAAHYDENTHRVAVAVARRRGRRRPDPASELLAGVGMVAVQSAIRSWSEGSARRDPAKVIADRFALLRDLAAR